jgi:hypothetical protein
MNLINKNSHIIIAGDSWGCGEWDWPNWPDTVPIEISHKGLEQYLIDFGCNVKNFSSGGASNLLACNSILPESVLYRHSLNISPIIIWFQTDPFRDFGYFGYPADYLEIFKEPKDKFFKIHDDLLDMTYARLNILRIPIYCIGGFSKLNLKLMKKYSYLVPVIPSVIEFLTDSTHSPTYSDWINLTDPSGNKVLSHDLVDFLYSEGLKWELLDKQWFWPDPFHPNRAGHKKIFDYLLNFKVA